MTADGGGDTVHYSHRHLVAGRLKTLYGGEDMILTSPEEDSLGKMYGWATKALGFTRGYHEGKVRVWPRWENRRGQRNSWPATGWTIGANRFRPRRRSCDLRIYAGTQARAHAGRLRRHRSESARRYNVAVAAEIAAKNKTRHVGLSGGVFSNVKLNRLLAETLDLDELYVFPAMGDDGLPVGGALAWLLQRDGLAHWLEQRRDLGSVYLGRDFSATADAEIGRSPGIRRLPKSPIDGAATRLKAGAIGAIYTTPYGVRTPRTWRAHYPCKSSSTRNARPPERAAERSEFMPFAPVIQREKATEVFDVTNVNRRACRYMTIACGVHPEWRARIPAVVHVDHSARPQIIDRADNTLYYDILSAFERETGLPVLVNTSFNVHEEPIVNTPYRMHQSAA